MRVYLDNAATTPMLPEVIMAMSEVMHNCYGNPSSIHAHGRTARAEIEKARRTIAKLLGASPSEIIFTGGGTEADNMALRRIIQAMGIRRIISSPIEHHAVTHTLEEISQTEGIEVCWLTPDSCGRHSCDELEGMLLDGEVTLVSLMHANNEIGTMIDLNEIGALCRRHGAYFHSDTVQTVGHFPFNLSEIPVDMITGAAHKFHGPKGVGFLYVDHSRIKIKPFITGGSQERNMRAGTENMSGIVGLAKAMELAYSDVGGHFAYITELRRYMLAGLRSIYPEIKLNGVEDPELYLPTVLNVCFPSSVDHSMYIMKLDIHGVSVSGGSACSSGSQVGSHVLACIGVPDNSACVRFSFSRKTDKADLDYALSVIKRLKDSLH